MKLINIPTGTEMEFVSIAHEHVKCEMHGFPVYAHLSSVCTLEEYDEILKLNPGVETGWQFHVFTKAFLPTVEAYLTSEKRLEALALKLYQISLKINENIS